MRHPPLALQEPHGVAQRGYVQWGVCAALLLYILHQGGMRLLLGVLFLGLPKELAALFVIILVHEGGHVLAGWLVGFQWFAVRVGPILLRRDGRRLRCSLTPAGMGGATLTLPSSDDHLQLREALVLAAGPLTGGAASAVFTWAILQMPTGEVRRELLVVGIFGLAVNLSNLLSLGSARLRTDGAKLGALLFGTDQAEQLCLLVRLQADELRGIPPQLWRRDLLQRAQETVVDSSTAVQVQLLAVEQACAAGELDRAEDCLRVALATPLPARSPIRPALLCRAAYFRAYYQGDAAGARAILTDVPARRQTEYLRCAAEAAMLAREGQLPEARRAAAAAIQALARCQLLGAQRANAEQWLHELQLWLQPSEPSTLTPDRAPRTALAGYRALTESR